jgi:hypothetical protein
MRNTKVIAAFPACGKSYCFERNEDYIILDSDSSKFSWVYSNGLAPRYRNPEFPKNYIEHIKENIGKVDYIFVSTHEEVRNALSEAGIDFTLVFPEWSLREEWVGRCFIRGSGEKFCQLIADQWEDWLSQMEEEVVYNKRKHYRLKAGEYLWDAMRRGYI